MKALWQLGEASGRQVQALLSLRRPLAYTTVMTLLDRLSRKGAAGRRKHGRSHLYHPLLSRRTALELAVDTLAVDFFDGSREGLASHLAAGSVARSAAVEPVLDEALL